MAGAAAGVLSGVPSTTWALLTGQDLLGAARAAGSLAPGRREASGVLSGLAVHAVVSAFWTAVLAVVLPRRGRVRGAAAGAGAGLAIAAVDLGLMGRRYPAVRALRQPPQWADHVAFGAVAGAVLGRPTIVH